MELNIFRHDNKQGEEKTFFLGEMNDLRKPSGTFLRQFIVAGL